MSESSSLSSCAAIEYHPHGRQGIGVGQPQSGLDYPLIQPADDIEFLLADLYVSYDDMSDYIASVEPLAHPFTLQWVYGLGCEGPIVTPPGETYPTHEADLHIVDANGRTVVNTTGMGTFSDREWGDRLHVYEWRGDSGQTDDMPDDAVVRIVVHTKWTGIDGEPVPREYDLHLLPESGVLAARTCRRRTKHVRSLTAVLTEVAENDVEFLEGNNICMTVEEVANLPGGRLTTQVVFDAEPGCGTGIAAGCDPEDLVVTQINEIRPTTAGDFFMGAKDCYFARQPTSLISTSPRRTLPVTQVSPGNTLDPDLPGAGAGESVFADGWPIDKSYAHLWLGNDCEPCCKCPDFVTVADYITKTRNRYHILGQEAESVRTLYHDNRSRWKTAKLCFDRQPLRLAFQPQICPYLDISAQFCNQSVDCLNNVVLTVTFNATVPAGGAATQIAGYGFAKGVSRNPNRRTPVHEKYTWAGTWPTFSAYFDSVTAFGSVSARLRLGFAECGGQGEEADFEPYVASATLAATADGVALQVKTADGTGLEAAADVQEVTLNCPADDDDTIDLTECIDFEYFSSSSASI